MNERLVETLSDLHERQRKRSKRAHPICVTNKQVNVPDAVTVVAYQNQKVYEEAG